MQFTDLNDYLRHEQFGAVELGCNYVTRSCHLSEWFDRSEQLVNCWHVKAHIALPVTQIKWLSQSQWLSRSFLLQSTEYWYQYLAAIGGICSIDQSSFAQSQPWWRWPLFCAITLHHVHCAAFKLSLGLWQSRDMHYIIWCDAFFIIDGIGHFSPSTCQVLL